MTLANGSAQHAYEDFDDVTSEHRRSPNAEELVHFRGVLVDGITEDRLWHRQAAGVFPPTTACKRRLVPVDHRPQSRIGPLCPDGCFSDFELGNELKED